MRPGSPRAALPGALNPHGRRRLAVTALLMTDFDPADFASRHLGAALVQRSLDTLKFTP